MPKQRGGFSSGRRGHRRLCRAGGVAAWRDPCRYRGAGRGTGRKPRRSRSLAKILGDGRREERSTMNAVWSPRAIRHLVAIREYIERDSDGNAALIAGRILEAVEILRTQPQMGRPGRLAGTRELVVSGTPYIVPYRVRRERLELLAVFDGRRQWPRRLCPRDIRSTLRFPDRKSAV